MVNHFCYSFPKNPELQKKWVEITGVSKISHYTVICSDHFDPECFHQTDGYTHIRRLLSNAVPSVRRIIPNFSNEATAKISAVNEYKVFVSKVFFISRSIVISC